VGSVWTAVVIALVAALLALAFAASPASAAIEGVSAEGASAEKDSATLNGWYVSADGKEAHYFFEWGETEAYGETTPIPPGAVAGTEVGFQTVPPVQISGLLAETIYHYRLVVSDADEIVKSADATFATAPAVANLTADPASAIKGTSAELNGSFDGDGTYETSYYFEWGPSTAYGNMVPVPPGNSVPAGSGRITLAPAAISGLESAATYHYRVKAANAVGTTVSADASFRTAEAPTLANVRSANVTASSAELKGDVNPRLGQTTYYFEWGPTAAYGNQTPVPAGDVGSANASVPVSVQLEGLSPGTTYHFRLLASNRYGTTSSPDQTLGFYPPACPNSQLRQETRSNDLPDCRAYELVTPTFAQGATVMPSSGPSSSVATSPARIAYGVNFGIFAESSGEAMNSINDSYVSTRSDSGWSQRYIGFRGGGEETPPGHGVYMGGPPGGILGSPSNLISSAQVQRGVQASPSLDRLVNYNWGFPGQVAWHAVGSNAPYVWNTSNGNLIERWPSNLAQVPGAEHAAGVPWASADLSHFVFSSSAVFAGGGEASGGEIDCCPGIPPAMEAVWPKASIYDNDVRTGAVVLASITKDNTPFEGRILFVSDDGSHILMAAESTLPGQGFGPIDPAQSLLGAEITGPLYMRVDATETLEIAPGRNIQYAGSTADGSTVYIASDEPLTPDDHDSSRDLFVWHESAPEALTRISVGDHGNAGNTDACTPSEAWTNACGISVIRFSTSLPPSGEGGNGHSDSYLSSKSGDIYFESPEQLVGAKGESNSVNLYLVHEGTVRFVATMPDHVSSGGKNIDPVSRMQVTPDGRYMALITGSHLIDHDGGGMFLYDREGRKMVCASCRPDGLPPTGAVQGSQNGLFLINDGRVFFSTSDPLVPRDTNEGVDVYEFTEGKAQLITTGLGPGIAQTGGNQNAPGLVNVSANGTDVYFATTDNLVTQDHNGAQIKIYDARTGGGFPAEREIAKCVAADECHGPGIDPPVLPSDRTSAGLGVTPKPRKKAHRAKKHKRSHKHKKHAGKVKRKSGSAKQGGKHHG